jgi:acyl-CoA thioester hydrolase
MNVSPYLYEMKPRFSDTDAYGVVHHSNFYKWLEETRIEFVNEVLGFTMREFEEMKYRFPVLSCSCTYKHPVEYGDTLRIEMWVRIPKAAKLLFIYRVYNAETNKLVAEAATTHVYMGPNGKMLLTHPEWFIMRVWEMKRQYPGQFLVEEME